MKYIQKVEVPTGGGKELEFAGLLLRNENAPEVFGWQVETVSGATVRPDTTTFECDSEKLLLTELKNIIYSEDVATPGSLGMIVSIGSPYVTETADWVRMHGLKFMYVCETDNWFNIYNMAELEGYDHKQIYTGTGGNIYFVRRAIFSYDSELFQWVLLSYTPAVWGNSYGIVGAANTDILVALALPQVGYYHFDCYVNVSETIDSVPENTGSPQILTVKASGDPTYGATAVAEVSDIYDPGVGGMTKMLSTHLTGSGIIWVDYDENDDLKMYVNVDLPNGTAQAILGGSLDLIYLGKLINY